MDKRVEIISTVARRTQSPPAMRRCEPRRPAPLHDGAVAVRERVLALDRPIAPGLDRLIELFCWSYARRKFFDMHKAGGYSIAREALDRIGALFDLEPRQQLQLLIEPLGQSLELLLGQAPTYSALLLRRLAYDRGYHFDNVGQLIWPALLEKI